MLRIAKHSLFNQIGRWNKGNSHYPNTTHSKTFLNFAHPVFYIIWFLHYSLSLSITNHCRNSQYNPACSLRVPIDKSGVPITLIPQLLQIVIHPIEGIVGISPQVRSSNRAHRSVDENSNQSLIKSNINHYFPFAFNHFFLP